MPTVTVSRSGRRIGGCTPGTIGRNSRLPGALQMICWRRHEPAWDERIISDHELTGFDQSGDQVTAHFRQRSTGETLNLSPETF